MKHFSKTNEVKKGGVEVLQEKSTIGCWMCHFQLGWSVGRQLVQIG